MCSLTYNASSIVALTAPYADLPDLIHSPKAS